MNKFNKDNNKQILTDINRQNNEIANEDNDNDNKDLKIFNNLYKHYIYF